MNRARHLSQRLDSKRRHHLYNVVCLVGFPGSGKSTLANKLVKASNIVRISQDELGSKDKCVEMAKKVLSSGGRVVIDRCNVSRKERVLWANLCRHPSQAVIVHLRTTPSVCVQRVLDRDGDHPTIRTTDKKTIVEIVDSFRKRQARIHALREGYDRLVSIPSQASDLDLHEILLHEGLL